MTRERSASDRRRSAETWCPRLECAAGPFQNGNELQEHLYDGHEVPRPSVAYACRACWTRFADRSVRDDHEATEHHTLFREAYKRRSGSIRQAEIVASTDCKWVCAIGGCAQRFTSKQGRGNHRTKMHPGWRSADVHVHMVGEFERGDVSDPTMVPAGAA